MEYTLNFMHEQFQDVKFKEALAFLQSEEGQALLALEIFAGGEEL